MKLNVTVTDTFNGEANYAWVRRHSFEVPDASSKYATTRKAKRMIGWNGKRCLVVDQNNIIEIRPYGECVVAFVEISTLEVST